MRILAIGFSVRLAALTSAVVGQSAAQGGTAFQQRVTVLSVKSLKISNKLSP